MFRTTMKVMASEQAVPGQTSIGLATLLGAGLLLAGCSGPRVMAPASAPSATEKPALSAPPTSMMTPGGY